MNYKVRIFQPLVPHYRVGLFKGLGERLPGRIEIYAPSDKGSYYKSVPVEGVLCDYTHPERKIGPFYSMKNATLDGLRRGDVVVIEGNIRKLSFLWIARQAKSKGIGVVWWGLHRMPDQNRITELLRVWAMKKLATTILFYNKNGLDWYKSKGEDCSHAFAVGNAIDLTPINKELMYWTPDRLNLFQSEQGISNNRIILVCSRLSDKVRLHEAIEAMSLEGVPKDIMLVVIGDGPLSGDLRKRAFELGVSSRIKWLGAMYDEHQMAPWFLSAKLFVYPGPVGLGVLHALAYGLPSVLNDTHNSTEAEAFENGKCGRMFKESDVVDLSRTILELLGDEVAMKEMGRYAMARINKYYTMEAMVDNYYKALEDAARQVTVNH